MILIYQGTIMTLKNVIHFDGFKDFIRLASSITLNYENSVLKAMIYKEPGERFVVFGRGSGANNGYIQIQGGELRYIDVRSLSRSTSSAIFPEDVWVELQLTFSSSRIYIALNSTLVDHIDLISLTLFSDLSQIGMRRSADGGGRVAWVEYTDNDAANNSFRWDIDEGAGTVLADSTGNGHVGEFGSRDGGALATWQTIDDSYFDANPISLVTPLAATAVDHESAHLNAVVSRPCDIYWVLTDKNLLAPVVGEIIAGVDSAGETAIAQGSNLSSTTVDETITGLLRNKAFRFSLASTDNMGNFSAVEHLEFATFRDTLTAYIVPSGEVCRAGRSLGTLSSIDGILNMLKYTPADSWIPINKTRFDSSWPDLIYRVSQGKPHKLIEPWSGFAWDHIHHRLIIYNGGHANYSGNDVYIWSAETLNWDLAFHTSQAIQAYPTQPPPINKVFEPIDGVLIAPQSSHTYKNNGYLEILDRFITFGGPCYTHSGQYSLRDANGGVIRYIAAYKLDMTLAGQGYVGGTANSDPSGTLPGAQAWEVCDYLFDHPEASTQKIANLTIGATNESVLTTTEGGRDVAYVSRTHGLFRIEFVDSDYRNDIITQISTTQVAGNKVFALDESRKIIVGSRGLSYSIFVYLDISDSNPSVPVAWVNIRDTDLIGSGVTEFLSKLQGMAGFEYDPIRDRFLWWYADNEVFEITLPVGDFSTGWTVTKITPSVPDYPVFSDLNAIGVWGKWRYARDLDCFIGLMGRSAGRIWLFKPRNWIDPRE